MADPNFEKQVQQKMEELTFAPSDAVWEKVDAEINKERKRRIPLFWLFFFAGLTVTGGIYFLSLNKKDKSIVSIISNPKNQSPEIKKEEIQKPVINTDSRNKPSTPIKENTVTLSSTEKTTGNKINAIPAKTNKHISNNSETSSAKKENSTDLQSTENKISISVAEKNKGVTKSKSLFLKSGEKSKVKDESVVRQNNNENLSAEKNTNNNEVAGNNKTAHIKNNFESAKTIDSTGIAEQQNKKNDSVKNIQPVAVKKDPATTDSLNNKSGAKNNKKTKQNSRWKFGASVSAGLSDVKQNLFKSTYVSNFNSYPTAVSNPGTTPGNIYTSSAINPGLSFSAGLFVKKLFSERISFSAGLNYHYYSTKIKIGYYSANTSYVYPTTGLNSIPVSYYYNSGSSNTYINHYHFLELPLLMDFQLNKNKKLPVYWEAGFTVSYLMNTDALHFDRVTGVYYQKNDLFNKTQASAATALMIGFPVHENILQIGPQFSYGFTRLLNKSTGNTEHLFFAGLKISTTFGKK